MEQDPTKEQSAECPCTRDCQYRGKCEECIEQHKTKKYLPSCMRRNRKKEAKS